MAASNRWPINGDLELGGKLLEEHFDIPAGAAGLGGAPAKAWEVDCVSINWGSVKVRTTGSARTSKIDWLVYVPFVRGDREEPCLLRIKQLLVIRDDSAQIGWQGGWAKLAVGTLYEARALHGPGFVTAYNEDVAQGPIAFPSVLRADLAAGYDWAIHISQIACSVRITRMTDAVVEGVTVQKTGFHG